MPRKIGDRVGAMLSANDKQVHLIGFGTYQGDHVPPDDIGGFNIGLPNPKLVMDDGTVVYGCECWWGSEAAVRAKIGDREIVQVDMAAARAESRRDRGE